VAQALPEYVGIRRHDGSHGAILKIAYEDIRLQPKSPLLQQLDDLELNVSQDAPDPPADTSIQPHAPIDESEESSLADFPGQQSLFMSNPIVENPLKDIGKIPSSSTASPQPPSFCLDLEYTEQSILKQLHETIGDCDAYSRDLEWVPPWLLEKAINTEKANNLKVCEPVHLKNIPARSNIISSHHFLRVKLESGTYRLKCRMVPHGNRDREKDGILTDSATAQFCSIRLLLSLAVLLKFRLSSLDISGAYLQAGPIQRDIYVRPPPGWSPRNILWHLTRPAYGIVESGRLWQLAIEEWLTKQGFSHVNGLSQLFVLRSSDGHILLLLAKVVDDLLVAGSIHSMNDFHNHLCNRFKVGRFVCNESFVFNALQITQDTASFAVTLDMHAYCKTRSTPSYKLLSYGTFHLAEL
jgi:hypothetical protein